MNVIKTEDPSVQHTAGMNASKTAIYTDYRVKNVPPSRSNIQTQNTPLWGSP